MVQYFKTAKANDDYNHLVTLCLLSSANRGLILVVDVLMEMTSLTHTFTGVDVRKQLQREMTAMERLVHFKGMIKAMAMHFDVPKEQVFVIEEPVIGGGSRIFKTPYPELMIYIVRHLSGAANRYCLNNTATSLVKRQRDGDEDDEGNETLKLQFRKDKRRSVIHQI